MRNASANYTIINSYEKEYSEFSGVNMDDVFDHSEDEEEEVYEQYGNATLVKVRKKTSDAEMVSFYWLAKLLEICIILIKKTDELKEVTDLISNSASLSLFKDENLRYCCSIGNIVICFMYFVFVHVW